LTGYNISPGRLSLAAQTTPPPKIAAPRRATNRMENNLDAKAGLILPLTVLIVVPVSEACEARRIRSWAATARKRSRPAVSPAGAGDTTRYWLRIA
jgi:hypothetical protein